MLQTNTKDRVKKKRTVAKFDQTISIFASTVYGWLAVSVMVPSATTSSPKCIATSSLSPVIVCFKRSMTRSPKGRGVRST